MARFAIALLMVALIGNPVCCCAFALCGIPSKAVGEADESTASCCCSKSAEPCAPRDGSDEAPDHACPCAKKTGATKTEPLVLPDPPSGAPLPFPLAASPLSPPLPDPAPFRLSRFPAKDPPGVGVPFRLLYAVFRC